MDRNLPRLHILLLAAGKGTRLSPITDYIPKPLIDVQGQTMIGRLCDQFSRVFDDVEFWVNISFFADKFLDFHLRIPKIIQPNFIWEPTQLGGASTLQFVSKKINGPILVLHSDLVLSQQYVLTIREDLINTNFRKNLIFCHSRARSIARSNVWFDRNGLVTSFQELEVGHVDEETEVFVNSGIYFFPFPKIFPDTRTMEGDIVRNQIQILIQQKSLYTRLINDKRISVDSVSSLIEARRYLS